MADKLKMVKNKSGDTVPFFAADGKGKMKRGGAVKPMKRGGAVKKKVKKKKRVGKMGGGMMKKRVGKMGGGMMKKRMKRGGRAK